MKRRGPSRDPGFTCPLMRKDVSEVCHKCDWYVQLRGTNPNTGEPVQDEWGCAVTMNLLVSVHVAQETRQTGAAIESFRNEVVRQHQAIVAGAALPQLEGPDSG